MRHLLLVSALGVLLAGRASADLLTVSESGTFASNTPVTTVGGVTVAAPNDTWSFSFLVPRNPTPSFVDAIGFNAPFSDFMYSLNGAAVSVMPVDIRFFTNPGDSGLFDIDLVANPTPDVGPVTGFQLEGPQVYTGTTAAPVIQPGVYTPTSTAFFSSGSGAFNANGGSVTISAVPEPASVALLLVIVVALGSSKRCYGKVVDAGDYGIRAFARPCGEDRGRVHKN